MDALRSIFLLLLACSFSLAHPTGEAILEEEPASEETRTRKDASFASVSSSGVKDVLAQTGGNGVLPCRFTAPGIVTWIRRKDRQLLTVGRGTHSIDTRFVVGSNSPDWTLLIKNVKREDAGLYECQVSDAAGGVSIEGTESESVCCSVTHRPSSKQIQTEPVQQQFVRLRITEAYSTIPGGPELHVKQGSSLRLECQLMASTESPSFIFWYREGRMINYDDEPGVRVEATKNGSILAVDKVKLSHGANYTCSPSNARPSYIMIHVIEEEEKPAAMHGGDRRNGTTAASVDLALIFLSFLGIRATSRLYPQQICVS